MSQELQDDDDPWSHAARSASQDGGDADSASPGPRAEDFAQDAVGAAAIESPPRKKSAGPRIVIGLAVLAAVGMAGSGVHNLYRKLVPAPQVGVAEDRREGSVDLATASGGAALPGMGPVGGAATTIGATPGTPPAPDDPQASAAPVAVSASAPLAVTVPAHPVPPAVEPPAAPAVAVAAARAQVGPAAQQVAAAHAEKAAERSTPVADVAKPLPEQVTGLPIVERHHARAARKHRREPQSAVARSGSSERAVRQLAPSHRTAKAGGTRSVAAPAAAVATEPIGTGTLTSYRIESIEPRFGEHQNAWIRFRNGRLQVLATGDIFEGGRVLRVDGAAYQVQTTQGVIR